MIYIILFFSLILRLINLNQSLWLDEAVQAITAQKSFEYIFQEITGDFHPPLYYFLMHFWVRLFGSSEIALRMPSVLFGVGTVYLLYKSMMHMHSRFVLVGAFFLATSQFHIYYSQEARMYGMACFLAALSMYFFIKINEVFIGGLKGGCHPDLDGGIPFPIKRKEIPPLSASWRIGRNDNVLFVCYFLSTLCLIYTDYYGFLILLAQGIYLLIKKKYRFLILNSLFIILCYLPWIPMFVTQIRTGMSATQTLPAWARLVNTSFLKAIPLTLIKFTIGRITIFNKTVYGLVILGVLGMLGVLGYLFYKNYKNSKDNKKIFLQLIMLWFFVPLIFSWLVSLFVPNFQPFRLLLILPAFYLLLVMGIENINIDFNLYRFRLKAGMTRKILICAILFVNLISLKVYYFNPYFYREDWRGVVGYLKTQKQVTILPSETSSWPIRYYDPGNEINMVYGATGVKTVGELKDLRELGGKVLYIRYLVSVFDPQELILKDLDSRGYSRIKEVSFNQIVVWEYRH